MIFMVTDYTFNGVLSGRRKSRNIPLRHRLQPKALPSSLSLKWQLYRGTDTVLLASGQEDYLAFVRRILPVMKIYRQQRERLAAVALDPTAQKLLDVLNQETSIKWGDLPDKADADWSEASRAAAILCVANLCEASPTRIRLSEYGDKMLAESSQLHQAHTRVEG